MNFNDNIPDIQHYNAEMQKGMIDKIFFVDIVDADVIVDYGCADGALLNALQKMYPNKTYIGYDINVEELEIAQRKYETILFYNDWNEIVTSIEFHNKDKKLKTAVVCSSIIHEIYHYGDHTDVKEFWNRIYNSNFDWIVIRDMCVSRALSRPSDTLSVMKIRQNYDPDMIAKFEMHWGTLESNWSLVHFLLKYRYTQNWSREVLENYFPIDFETLINRVPVTYVPVVVDHHTHAFTRMCVERDFAIQLQDRTHLKMILRRV